METMSFKEYNPNLEELLRKVDNLVLSTLNNLVVKSDNFILASFYELGIIVVDITYSKVTNSYRLYLRDKHGGCFVELRVTLDKTCRVSATLLYNRLYEVPERDLEIEEIKDIEELLAFLEDVFPEVIEKSFLPSVLKTTENYLCYAREYIIFENKFTEDELTLLKPTNRCKLGLKLGDRLRYGDFEFYPTELKRVGNIIQFTMINSYGQEDDTFKFDTKDSKFFDDLINCYRFYLILTVNHLQEYISKVEKGD